MNCNDCVWEEDGFCDWLGQLTFDENDMRCNGKGFKRDKNCLTENEKGNVSELKKMVK